MNLSLLKMDKRSWIGIVMVLFIVIIEIIIYEKLETNKREIIRCNPTGIIYAPFK